MKRIGKWIVMDAAEYERVQKDLKTANDLRFERFRLKGENDELRNFIADQNKLIVRTKALSEMEPLKKEQLLEGLQQGPEDPAIRSVMAIIKGLREVAVGALANQQTTSEQADMFRGHLACGLLFEKVLFDCWSELRKKAAKPEMMGG